MASVDLRRTYELLHRAMQQYSQQQQGADFASTPNVASEDNSSSYGSPQGGLPGRLLALQGEQSQYQPAAENPGQAPSESENPNFRQLSRADRVRAFPDPSSENPAPHANEMPAPAGSYGWNPTQMAPPANGGPFGAYSDKPMPLWGAPSPMMTAVPFGWRGRGIPMPPMGPVSLPPIPMPTIPDWWRTAGKLLQMYARISSGQGGGGEDGGDDDCKEEKRAARKICTDAFANGWKSDYGVGPYRKSTKGPWTIQDCMRGFISQRCGGNVVTGPDEK